MIYIITQESEYTTDRVMDWLYSFNQPVTRLNGQDMDRKDNLLITIDNKNKNHLFVNNIKIRTCQSLPLPIADGF